MQLTLPTIKTKLAEATGIPVAYTYYPNAKTFPYIVYDVVGDSPFSADDERYLTFSRVEVDLYTKYRDPALVKKVEDALTSLDVYFSKQETIVEDPECYNTIFTFNAIITED